MNILVFDLGTTNFKASVFDTGGALLALTRLPTPVISEAADRREISPKAFWGTLTELAHGLNAQSPHVTESVGALTFATQTNSFILLDEREDPLTPIILWSDNRAVENMSVTQLLADVPRCYATTGVPALSHQFMIAKLEWLRAYEPDRVERTARLCLISDYLTLLLTGQQVTEAGTAGLTGLVDIHALDWWDEACTICDIPTHWRSRVESAGADLGLIDVERSRELGLPERCRFIVGCLDQYAGAIGAGNVVSGRLSETTGTVLSTVKCVDEFQPGAAPGVFQGPAFPPGRFYQMSFGSTAANWLKEFRDALPDTPSFADLDAEASRAGPCSCGIFLRPDSDPAERRAILEELLRYSRGHAVRAILEAVSFALADQVTLLCGEHAPREIASAGGAARSTLWLQIKADVLNRAIVKMQNSEPTSQGAAILAMHALSGETVSQVTARWIQTAHRIVPDTVRHRLYRLRRGRYPNASASE